MRGSCCTLLLLLALAPPSQSAPAEQGACGSGCRCYPMNSGDRGADCTSYGKHAKLPTGLHSLKVHPHAPGFAYFLERRLPHHAHYLKELHVDNNEVVGPRVRYLRGLYKLRRLSMSYCEVSSIDEITPLFETLVMLRLNGNPLTSLPTLESKTLKEMDLSDCHIGSLRADTFSGLTNLGSLNLARNPLTKFAADLPDTLRQIDLSGVRTIDNPDTLIYTADKRAWMIDKVDVTDRELSCTCDVLQLRNRRDHHVVVGSRVICADGYGHPHLRGLSLPRARGQCEHGRLRRQADPLDLLEGSGGDEGDGIGADEETGDDFADDDYDEEIDDGTGTGGADDASGTAQLGPQSVEVEGPSSSSSAPPVPASNDDTTRSLEDDIYEPTVPPPIPAAVDADAAAQPPSETPPESGPPAAEAVEGSHAESGDVDGIHKEDSEPVAAGAVSDSEDEKKNAEKEEDDNTDIDDGFNEVIKSEDGVDENEDYDYDEEAEATTDEISLPHHFSLDTVKEGEHETASQFNETEHPSPETGEEKETFDSSPFAPEEESDKDYEESEADVEEKANEVEDTDDVAVPGKVSTAESTETAPASSEVVHTNTTSDAVATAHDAEPHEDTEDATTDIKIIGEAEGSGDGDNDDSLPIGPITGFIDSSGHDGATTTEEPDEGMLMIDEEERDENNSPLVPPSADDESKITTTPDNTIVESDVVNNTERETSVHEHDDGEGEGSGMSVIDGGGEWDVENTNETDEEPEVTSLAPTEIHDDDLIAHRILPVESGRDMSPTSESPLTTSTTEKPVEHGGLLHLHEEEDVTIGADVVSSSTAPPNETVEERIVTAPPVPIAEAVPSEEPLPPPVETSPPSEPVVTSEVPVELGAPEWAEKEPSPGQEPDDVDQINIPEVETVMPTGDAQSNDTARVVLAGGEKPAEETPLNSAGSYVVLGIIMALVVFLLGYAVMRSRRGRQRAAAKASGKDAEAAAGQQEGRELKELSKPLLAAPPAAAANGKGEHLQPLVTKPADNPDLKDQDDGDEPAPEKSILQPKTHIYETLNGGEKERVPVHPPSPKKSPSSAPDTLPGDNSNAVDSHTPPVPEKRRVLSRLPETAVDGGPNMYAADGLPGEVVAQPQQQQPTANGAATSPVNGLSTFAPPVSPSSGRVKVVAREDPDSVPKKPVFVVNQGPNTAGGVV